MRKRGARKGKRTQLCSETGTQFFFCYKKQHTFGGAEGAAVTTRPKFPVRGIDSSARALLKRRFGFNVGVDFDGKN